MNINKIQKSLGYLVIVLSVMSFTSMIYSFEQCTQFCNFAWFVLPFVVFFFGIYFVEDSNG